MDLYSANVGAIQEGNMRSQSIMDANRAIQDHNNDLAGQIASLKAQQQSGQTEEGIKNAIGGFISAGKIGGQVQAFKDWADSNKGVSPMTLAQNTLQDGLKSVANTTTDTPELAGVDKTVVSDAGDAVKKTLSFSDEAIDKLGKVGGDITSVGMAGMDIYKDIQADGIAGDNWASKTSNVLQIGGAIADVGGTVFPPLALLGGTLDIASGVAGEIGDLIHGGTQDQKTDELQEQETEKPISTPLEAQAPATTGRVS
jgi:hypothetical protein